MTESVRMARVVHMPWAAQPYVVQTQELTDDGSIFWPFEDSFETEQEAKDYAAAWVKGPRVLHVFSASGPAASEPQQSPQAAEGSPA